MPILAAIDDTSTASRLLLSHLGAFAAATSGELLLAHILPPSAGAASDGHIARWEADLRTMLADEGVPGTPAVVTRAPGERIDEAIVRVASEAGAWLIAATSSHLGPLQHAVGGSVTLDVVAFGSLPVFVAGPMCAPATVPRGRYRLLVACDLSGASAGAIRTVAQIAARGSIEVALLHVYLPRPGDAVKPIELEIRDKALTQLREQLPGGIRVRQLLHSAHEWERAEDAILRVALAFEANAIALSTRGHSAARHLLIGSVAMALLAGSPLPVILMKG